jgi:hypothetical protein
MSNYTINDLRGDLAETLRKLRDGDPNMTIEKAKAISEIGQTMINSAKVEVEFIKTVGRGRTSPTGFVPITHEDTLDRQERTGVTVRHAEPGRIRYDQPPKGPQGSL